MSGNQSLLDNTVFRHIDKEICKTWIVFILIQLSIQPASCGFQRYVPIKAWLVLLLPLIKPSQPFTSHLHKLHPRNNNNNKNKKISANLFQVLKMQITAAIICITSGLCLDHVKLAEKWDCALINRWLSPAWLYSSQRSSFVWNIRMTRTEYIFNVLFLLV